MLRTTLHILSDLSLVGCVLLVFLWLRSCSHNDMYENKYAVGSEPWSYGVRSDFGRIIIFHQGELWNGMYSAMGLLAEPRLGASWTTGPASDWTFHDETIAEHEWRFAGIRFFRIDEVTATATGWVLTIHHWHVAVLLAILPAIRVLRFWFGPRRRRRLGLCVQCGYDLRGSAGGACPECGAPQAAT